MLHIQTPTAQSSAQRICCRHGRRLAGLLLYAIDLVLRSGQLANVTTITAADVKPGGELATLQLQAGQVGGAFGPVLPAVLPCAGVPNSCALWAIGCSRTGQRFQPQPAPAAKQHPAPLQL